MEQVIEQPTVVENILDILEKMGKIPRDDLVVLKDKYRQDPDGLEKALLGRQIANAAEIAKAYASYFNLPYVSLAGKKIPLDILQKVPEKAAREYLILPYHFENNILKIALAQPWRLAKGRKGVISDIRRKRNINIALAITTPEDLKEGLEGYKQKPPVEKPIEHPKVAAPKQEKKIVEQSPPKAKIPFVSLKKLDIPTFVLQKFPFEIADKYRMVVFSSLSNDRISVAAENPLEPRVAEILDFIRRANELKIELFQTSKDDIDFALQLYSASTIIQPKPEVRQAPAKIEAAAVKKPPVAQKPKEGQAKEEAKAQNKVPEVTSNELKIKETLSNAPVLTEEVAEEERNLDTFLGKPVTTVEQLEEIVKNGNVPQIVAAILYLGVKEETSDVHLEPSEQNFRVRFRIDGILQDILKMPLSLHPPIISRIKILAKLKIDEQRIPQDGRFDLKAAGHNVDLRIATLPTVRGEKVAIRLLDKTTGVKDLTDLGFMGKGYDILILNIQKPYGIILATGPTGSGKTTTLYAVLNRLNKPSVNIVTLEDPVEYEIAGLNQCQIKPKIGFSFADGLRSVVRQDPNVIMVGEIRDTETAAMATHAALTGHLVLSTLHTNDAASALPRLINMGVEPFLITSSINVIIAQRLVRKLCPSCRKEFELPRAVMIKVKNELEQMKLNEPLKFYKSVGCNLCSNGYHGRIGIYEVLPMTDKIEDLAVAKYPASKINQAAIGEGMITMLQDGILKALKGFTSIDEVFRVTMAD